MIDAIRLTVPYGKPYQGVARLVVGGLGARLDFSYESLEDLQLALESVLTNEAYAAASDVTVELRVAPRAVEMLVGPLDARRLRPDLEHETDPREGVGLRRLLTTVVEGFELTQRDGGEWLRFEKRLPEAQIASPA